MGRGACQRIGASTISRHGVKIACAKSGPIRLSQEFLSQHATTLSKNAQGRVVDRSMRRHYGNGRGPMRPMSPLITLISCGSSSIPLRSHRPIFVGSGYLMSDSTGIVRNLYITNFLPLAPTRFALKNVGPGESSFIKMAEKIRRGARSERAATARVMSKVRIPTRDGKPSIFQAASRWRDLSILPRPDRAGKAASS
jgi:hypothetical protein